MEVTIEIPESLRPSLERRASEKNFAKVDDYVLSLVREDVSRTLGPFDIHTPEQLAEALRVAEEAVERGEPLGSEATPSDFSNSCWSRIDGKLRHDRRICSSGDSHC